MDSSAGSVSLMGEWLLALVPWGAEWIVRIQALRGGVLDFLMLAITNLGSSFVFAPATALLYWCCDKRAGAGLAYLLLCSSYVNDVAKLAFGIARPADPRIVVLQPEGNPSFPSGHTQNALVVAGYVGVWLRRRWVWLVAGALALLVAFSRLYLGVHYPQDIVGGWLIGAALLTGWLWLGPRAVRWPLWARLALALAAPLVLLLVYPRDAAGLYAAGNAARLAGLLLGVGVGFVVEDRYVRFATGPGAGESFGSRKARKEGGKRGRAPAGAARLWELALRLMVGGAAVGLAYVVPAVLAPAVRFLRYGLAGFTFACVAPWLFVRLGLAGTIHE